MKKEQNKHLGSSFESFVKEEKLNTFPKMDLWMEPSEINRLIVEFMGYTNYKWKGAFDEMDRTCHISYNDPSDGLRCIGIAYTECFEKLYPVWAKLKYNFKIHYYADGKETVKMC